MLYLFHTDVLQKKGNYIYIQTIYNQIFTIKTTDDLLTILKKLDIRTDKSKQ